MPATTLTWQSIAPAISEIYLVAAICLILLVDVFAGQARRRLTPTLTLILLAVGAALQVFYGGVAQRTVLFDGMYVADQLGHVLKLAGYLFVAFGLYTVASEIMNIAIAHKRYYSGSFYDLPFFFALCWTIWAAVSAGRAKLEASTAPETVGQALIPRRMTPHPGVSAWVGRSQSSISGQIPSALLSTRV